MVACDYVGFVRLFFFCSAGLELGSPWKQGIFSLRMTAPVLYVWLLNRVRLTIASCLNGLWPSLASEEGYPDRSAFMT